MPEQTGKASKADAFRGRSHLRPASVVPVVPVVQVVRTPGALRAHWQAVASIGGKTAVWAGQFGPATLVSFNQALSHLTLHAGRLEPGGGGWPHGDRISAAERRLVLAGFNGGFKLSYGVGGFRVGGRGSRLREGLGSIVTYSDGYTDIGTWGVGVPQRGRAVASVLQNLHLLVDHGRPAAGLEECVLACWGATLGGSASVARSALGIGRSGQLVWAAGEHLTPAQLARALVSVGSVRAVELDINPEWVAGYLYSRSVKRLAADPLVPEQPGIPGQLLTPYSRDFFTVLAA
jgi:hypothetical protein